VLSRFMDDQILITGAARGLGLAMTRDLLGELRSRFGEQLGVHVGDVTDEESLQRTFADVGQRLGKLDIIINNAVTYLDGSRPTIEEADLSICARTFEVNAVAPLRVVQHGLPLIRKGRRKLIVNISSEAGSIGDCRRTAEYAYCMSKSALNMGSKLLQNHLQPEGIKVLALHPGWFNSSGAGPAPISAEEAAVKVLQTILKPHGVNEPMYLNPDGNPLPW
jgi:NAD(P)-dependent dehydrogenase (short-subunit alcohol dehydrogenase family)